MDLHKLGQRSFNRQMLRYGYLSEQVPECFSSASFGDHVLEIMKIIRGHVPCEPVTLSTYKTGPSRRIISIPNPYAYAATVKLMGDNWKMLRDQAVSENSLSRIIYCRRYHDGLAEALNNEQTRLHYKSKSTLVKNVKACMAASLGFRYRLKVDISSCYDSINPRTLFWALFGREQAERFILHGPSAKAQASFDFAKRLAKSVSFQSNDRQNGIMTGPYTSRIFSEIVLSCIDRDLRGALGKRYFFAFRRYVDDYRFFFKTESEVTAALTKIEEILAGYDLRLNHSKTTVDIYPFESFQSLRRRYEEIYADAGMCALLSEAGRLHADGVKGALKYALKMARSRAIDPNDAEAALAMLFNFNLIYPECSRYVAAVIAANRDCFRTESLAQTLSEQIVQDLAHGFDQEVLDSLYFAKKLGLPLSARCVLEVLRQGCDLAVIIALDYWRNRRELVAPTPYETRLINAQRRDLERRLKGASLDESHWMLLYESHRHGLLRSVSVDKGATAWFFERLDKMGVDFYRP